MVGVWNSLKAYLLWLKRCMEVDCENEEIELNEEQKKTLEETKKLEEGYIGKSKEQIVEKIKINAEAARRMAEKAMANKKREASADEKEIDE